MQTYASVASARRGMVGDDMTRQIPRQLDSAANAGIFVTQGASDGSCKAPASAAEVTALVGAVLYNAATAKQTSAQATDYLAAEMVSIANDGLAWMQSETAQTRGSQPYVRHTAGAGGSELGVIRNTADTATATLAPNCRVELATTGAGPCLVRFNLPYSASP